MSIRQGRNVIAGNYAVNEAVSVLVDEQTIIFNEDDELTALGVQDKNTGAIKFDWIGTTEEYEQAWANGEISDTDVCFITDDFGGNLVVHGSSKQIGEIFYLSAPEDVIGCKRLNGQTLDYNANSDFYNWCLQNKNKAQTNSDYEFFNKTLDDYNLYMSRNGYCPYYIVNEAEKTVKLPTYKLTDSNDAKVYSYICVENIVVNQDDVDRFNSCPPLSILISDHVLTGDRAIGWAIQGSRISSTYETVLTHIKEDKMYGSYAEDKIFNKLWIDKIKFNSANITEKGIATFSRNTNVMTPTEFNPSTQTWQLIFKIRTSEDVINNQSMLDSNYCLKLFVQDGKFALCMSSNGTAWNMTNNNYISSPARTNSNYWFKIGYKDSRYYLEYSQDGYTFVSAITFNSSVAINPAQLIFGNSPEGSNPFKGQIDLLECNLTLNNRTFWQPYILVPYIKAVDRHKIVDITNKSIVDEVYNRTGTCPYYVLDDILNYFYLPKNNSFMGFSVDTNYTNNYGQGQTEQITGRITIDGIASDYNGSFYTEGTNTSNLQTVEGVGGTSLSFDSSRTVNTGQRVQPPHSKYLIYYRVGNTVVNTELVNFGNVTSDIGLLQLDVADLQNNKLNKDLSNIPDNIDYVIEQWIHQDGSSWYIKYKGGFIICGGIATTPAVGMPAVISFPAVFTRKPYLTLGRQYGGSITSWTATYENLTKTGANIYTTQATGDASMGEFCWVAMGY